MTPTSHLVFGTGLVGGYLSGCFLASGITTTLYGREKSQKAFSKGLTVSDYEGNKKELPAPIFHTAINNDTYDIIWLAVKCLAVEGVIKELRTLIHENSIIVCCQNGFGSDQAVIEAFPNNDVLSAIVGFNVSAISEAHLMRSTEADFVIQSHPATINFFEQLNSPLLPSHLTNDVAGERWAKLQLNLGNPINALSDIPVKRMLEYRGYRLVITAMMNELIEVTKGLDIELPKIVSVPGKLMPKIMSLPNWIFKLLAQKMLAVDPSARTSMWWDLSQSRLTEIDYINGAVVAAAETLGMKAPVNKAIVELVHSIERGERTIGIKPEQLKTEIL